ncbi:Helix-turn-helix domain containing protein [Desulfocurvibacter africanus PCS]|uniref:Helix-turn-helix domain containing protein n=1 Tax=Desulfocurvibacter africanus PCS TaxID=1262666 RepID=M5PR35_DESAF|nr:helix-turn-helix domain-containing protein [Desulfocurvibacter africanus]EMG36579.1 Helix-turn-helix domain containing protein [Desulfocurvibacter africanus PCS]
MTIQVEAYLTLKEAAQMCRYSARHFRDLVKQDNIPTYGRGLNRFRVSDLHAWMENPDVFKVRGFRRVRRGQGFTPVKVA